MTRLAATHLMFSGNAADALALYSATFQDFRTARIERYGPGAPGPEGGILRADATLGRHELILIDSPVQHDFTFTPAVSLFVESEDRAEFDRIFGELSVGGTVLMPPGNYGFSAQFAWFADRFGVSWQLNLG